MTSTLVKASFHGSQLNWGRLAAAAGRAGVPLDPSRLSILIGDVEVVREGAGVEASYAAAQPLLQEREVQVTIDLGLGEGSFRGWTSDLSLEYVRFNSGELT
jgi:glutamate N-acetyltransferase / amino-acid N-acetyltransferase